MMGHLSTCAVSYGDTICICAVTRSERDARRALDLRPGDRARTDDGREGTIREMLRVFDDAGEDAVRSTAVVSVGGIAVVKSFRQIGAA